MAAYRRRGRVDELCTRSAITTEYVSVWSTVFVTALLLLELRNEIKKSGDPWPTPTKKEGDSSSVVMPIATGCACTCNGARAAHDWPTLHCPCKASRAIFKNVQGQVGFEMVSTIFDHRLFLDDQSHLFRFSV